ERNGKRAAPLLVLVLHAGRAAVCGPAGDDPPAYPNLEPGQVERVCREALGQPDRHAALRFLRDALPAVVESRLPALRNERSRAPKDRPAAPRRSAPGPAAARKARAARPRRDDALLRGLGFQIEAHNQVTSTLRAARKGTRLAVTILLRQSE